MRALLSYSIVFPFGESDNKGIVRIGVFLREFCSNPSYYFKLSGLGSLKDI